MDHLLWKGGGISYRISNDPGIESTIPDFIIRSESAENDFISKPRLHSIYVNICELICVLNVRARDKKCVRRLTTHAHI